MQLAAEGPTDLATLLLELGGILFGLGLLGALALRVGLSPIPLYLLVGLAFGEGGLLPLATSQEFVRTGAEIGVVLLLLTLGLQYSADDLLAGMRTTAPAGLLDVVLNALPGAAAALLLGWGPTAALVLGGITYISSSGVIAKVLSDLGWLGNRETPTVLAVLVFEDLAMAVYLPVLTALLAGLTLGRTALSLLVALTAVTLVMVVALRAGPRLSRLVFSLSGEILLLRVLGLALLIAGLAQLLQVSAAVGAFLVGLMLSEDVAEGARAVLTPLRDLFAAVFFVFFGLQIDPSSVAPVVVPAVLLAAVTALTKVATGWWAARRAGYGHVARARAGAALIARGEFSIVIAGLAVTAGVEGRLATLAGTYVLLMALIGPLAARVAEPLARRTAPRE
jgi:monovalent cation:H+ antiporter-2, CPA2 family